MITTTDWIRTLAAMRGRQPAADEADLMRHLEELVRLDEQIRETGTEAVVLPRQRPA